MRISATMWGGAYNPIVPVFQVGPRGWQGEKWERAGGKAIARGYVEFFEPDAFVEAEHGLLADTSKSSCFGEGSLRCRAGHT